MKIDFLVEGNTIGSLSISLTALARVMASAQAIENGAANSTPMTPRQVKDLVGRIDPKSAELLGAFAKSEDGRITWSDMKQILEIEEWKDFSGRFGKGITRALRYLLEDPQAKLIHWNDDEWPEDEQEWDTCEVWIDGQALESIKTVFQTAA